MGDHVRLVMLEGIVNEIQQKNLLKLVRESGAILLDGLKELEVRVQ
jgi:4-aminobutyrate aminotransferase-like enzyme